MKNLEADGLKQKKATPRATTVRKNRKQGLQF